MIPSLLIPGLCAVFLSFCTIGTLAASKTLADSETIAPFYIQVVDEETGRGVPLVQISTHDWCVWWTDSNGIAAITDPDLQSDPTTGRSGEVWVFTGTWGYTDPANYLQDPGRLLTVTPGTFTRIEIMRDIRAERLYRFTGMGVFKDSLLAGLATPLADPTNPTQAANVAGQDSTQVALYKGRAMYFFGDTLVRQLAFGVMQSTGASSTLDVDVSSFLELEYYSADNGTSPAPMVPVNEAFTWVQAFATVYPGTASEALLGFYAIHDGDSMNTTTYGSMRWDDSVEHFQLLVNFTGAGLTQYCTTPSCFYVLWEGAHSLLATAAGEPCNASDPGAYVYLACPTPLVRFPATPEAFESFDLWESYTPLKEGDTLAQPGPQLERDPETGALVYGWKLGTGALGPDDEQEFINRGEMSSEESMFWGATVDAETGDALTLSGGDIQWSEHRQRWVYISQRDDDVDGQVWYSESAELLGPYNAAVKIISHEDFGDIQHNLGSYTFYNVVQLAFAAEGRNIYVSGTLDAATDNSARTNVPRYDYNNIVYRLDLDRVARFFNGTNEVGRATRVAARITTTKRTTRASAARRRRATRRRSAP